MKKISDSNDLTIEGINGLILNHIYIDYDVNSNVFKNRLLSLYGVEKFFFNYNENGKPYLKNSDIYFNISHTKNLVVGVVLEKEVGIDIEMFTYKPEILSRICNFEELRKIENSKNKEFDFTKMWVTKEAYLKMNGLGLNYDLRRIDTINLCDKCGYIYNKDFIIAVMIKDK